MRASTFRIRTLNGLKTEEKASSSLPFIMLGAECAFCFCWGDILFIFRLESKQRTRYLNLAFDSFSLCTLFTSTPAYQCIYIVIVIKCLEDIEFTRCRHQAFKMTCKLRRFLLYLYFQT